MSIRSNLLLRIFLASSTSAAAIQRAERFRKFLHLPYWLDCPLICYVGLATLLFVVGLTVTIITTGNPALSKKQDEKSGEFFISSLMRDRIANCSILR